MRLRVLTKKNGGVNYHTNNETMPNAAAFKLGFSVHKTSSTKKHFRVIVAPLPRKYSNKTFYMCNKFYLKVKNHSPLPCSKKQDIFIGQPGNLWFVCFQSEL